MALQAVVNDLAEVPEDLHEHYEANGDVFRLRVEGYDDTALKRVNEDLRGKNQRLRERLDTVPDDFDRAELEELRKLRDAVHEKEARAAGDWDRLKTDLEVRHSKLLEAEKREREAVAQRYNELAKQHEHHIGEGAATAALADAGARVTAMLPHVMKRVSVVAEDGNFRAVATGLDGEPTDIPTLVSQMKAAGEDWDWGFQPSLASGGGAVSRGGAGRAGQVRTKADLGNSKTNPAAHAKFIADHGLDAYRALPTG